MSINFDHIFGIHSLALTLREKRTEILASNLANADTPGYKARDFDFQSVLQNTVVPPLRLAATQPAHYLPNMDISGSRLMFRHSAQPSLDGNTVETHMEQMAFAENALHYQASLRFIDGKISGLMTAIKGE
jgi:flagellar basal-body rod protein FlgB